MNYNEFYFVAKKVIKKKSISIMKLFYTLLVTVFISVFSNAQTFEGKTGTIADNTTTIFDLEINNLNNKEKGFGLETVFIDIDHTWNSDLEIYLIAPNGIKIKLVAANGGSSHDYKNTIFSQDALMKITDAEAPFTGTFLPEDYLGIANRVTDFNGKWQLKIIDTYEGNFGKLNSWGITFGNKGALVLPPAPPCSPASAATYTCANAPLICDLGGYCGNTVGEHVYEWPALTSTFCGGIQNNSFIKFIASAATANFNVWVHSCTRPPASFADGVQLYVFETTACGSGPVTAHGCINQIFPTVGGVNGAPTVFTATSLTPGNTYYLMFDGCGGDVCNFVVGSQAGVNVINVSPSAAVTCAPGQPVTLTASGSSGYTWASSPAGFTASGASVTVSPLVTTTYTINSVSTCVPKTVTVTVGSPITFTSGTVFTIGSGLYNLDNHIPALLNGNVAANFDITFYHSQSNAQSLTNPILNSTTYAGVTGEVIWVAFTQISGAACTTVVSFTLNALVATNSTTFATPICSNGTFNLFATAATATTIYNWAGPNGFTSNLQNPTNVPAPTGTGPHIYTLFLSGTSSGTSSTTVYVTQQPSAGISGGNTIPITDPFTANTISLFSFLSGTPNTGGTWVRNSGTGGAFNAVNGTYTPGLYVAGVSGTTSTFTYTIGTAPCNAVSSIATVTIQPPPFTINNPTPYVVCDDNAFNDGIAGFDLHTKDIEVTTNPLLEVHYFYTLADANGNTNEILVNPFFNIDPSFQTIYIRVHYTTDPNVYVLTSLDLQVNPRPLQNLVLTPLEVCDFTAPHNGVEPFNLHDKDLDIANGQTGVTVNYYDTQANAILNDGTTGLLTSPYTIPTSTPIATTQTIYYNISFDSNGCGTVGPLDLIVNSLPVVPLFYTPFQQCELETDLPNPNDGIMLFNFENYAFPTTGPNGLRIHLYPSPNDAMNDTNEINPLGYYNTMPYAQTLGVRLTNVLTGCYSLSTLDLIVNPLPNPLVLPVSMTSVCDDGLLGVGCFNLNSFTANIINGAANVNIRYYLTDPDAQEGLLSNIINTAIPFCTSIPGMQPIFVRETNTLTGCFKVITLNLTVTPKPLLPISAPNLIKDLVFCDEDLALANNQDGTTTVDLTTQTTLLLNVQTQPASNYTVTYYTSFANATNTPNGLAPIVYPAAYLASNNAIIWVRIQDNVTGCFNYTSFKIIINTPLALLPATFLKLCDDGPTTVPPTRVFDLLNLGNPLIIGSAVNYDVAYYLTQADANSGINAVPLSYTNSVNPQDLFVVVTSLQGCRSFSTITLEVLPLPTPRTNPADLQAKCDDDANNTILGFEYFNLTQNAVYITNGLTNVTLSYHLTYSDADLDINPILNPALALVSGDVYIRVESNLPGNCYVVVTQKLKVLPLPKVAQLDATTHPNNTYQICQNPNLLTPAQFNLTALIPELLINNPAVLLPAIPPTFTTTFYTTFSGANSGTGQITNPSAYISTSPINVAMTIYVRVVNNQTGCVNYKGNFEIIVNPKPKVNLPANPLNTCDTDGTNNGLFSYPLTQVLIDEILGATQTSGYTVSFYDNLADANSGSNPIINKLGYMGYTHSLWIRVQNNVTRCYEIGEQKQIVEKLPDPTITTTGNVHSICVNYTTNYIDRGLTLNANYTLPYYGPTPNTYQWYEGNPPVAISGETASTYLVPAAPIGANNDLPRVYRVEIKSTSPSPRGCSAMSPSFEVIQSGQAENQIGTNGYLITNAFTENQIVTVTVQGYGTYQYSLDGGTPQESPVFENVTLGTHSITVIDVKDPLNACLVFPINNVQTIDYPHYFTPNGDGIQDYWNINGLGGQLDAKIYIFDRQGKLMKQVAPNNIDGWDGTYNNALMPSTDYWFTVDFKEQTIQKQFKAHFSLKR
jgi:gliding motility-associated-like protein